jgi:hypothetical protein
LSQEGQAGVANEDDKALDGGKSPQRKRATLHYPQHAFRPEDLLDFLELPVFTKRWKSLQLDEENDLLALQVMIMTAPKKAKPLSGTSGLRKLRFAPARWNTGKSGAARVLYVYFEEYGLVLLCLIYGKNEVDEISDAVKRRLNVVIKEIKRELRRRYSGKRTDCGEQGE